MARRITFFGRFGKEKISYQNLAKLNMAAAVVLGLEALAILILADPQRGIVGVTANYLSQDTLMTENSGQAVYLPAAQHLFDLKLAYLVAAVLLAAGIGRWLAASFRRKRYESGLRKETNKHSWAEHGVVLALMMLTVGMLSGILDLVSLLFIIFLSGMVAWLGHRFSQSYANPKNTDWHLFTVALKSGLWIWLAIIIYLAGALIWGRGLPAFVYWIYASMALVAAGFAYNVYCSAGKRGRWAGSLWGERVYVVLTVVGASALAWQVFAGTLR